MILAGGKLAIEISAYFIKNGRWRANQFLAGSSFFLFAYHFPVVGISSKLLWTMFKPKYDIAVLGLYFLSVTITVIIGVTLYWGIKKMSPGFATLITGGR